MTYLRLSVCFSRQKIKRRYLQVAVIALSMRSAVDAAAFESPEDLADHLCIAQMGSGTLDGPTTK